MKTTIRNTIVFGLLALFAHLASAGEPTARILKLVNPAQSTGVHIGDVLQRKVVVEVSAPYQISSTALPMKGFRQDGIEVSDVQVHAIELDQKTRYEIALKYQVFAHAPAPAIMVLPAEELALTGGPKALSIKVPAWRFWFSPLVVADISTAKDNMQPQLKPTLIVLETKRYQLAGFLALFAVGLMGLVYFNADSRWLPFMNGAFAQAHRKIRKLPRDQEEAWKTGLFHVHAAFNKLNGRNLFADDLARFLVAHPEFGKAKAEIQAFFDTSSKSLFAAEPQDSAAFIQYLLGLSKHLRDCERGAA